MGGPPSKTSPHQKGEVAPKGGPPTPWPAQGGYPSRGPPPPNMSPLFVGGLPPKGAPNISTFHDKRGLPPKGGAPYKTAPQFVGSCPPSGDTVFFARVPSEKFLKVPELFGTL